MRYYLIAGEASGDLHGAALMQALKDHDPQAEFRFRGGDRMAAVGGSLFRHYKDTAVMGIVEVAAKAGRILADLRSTKEDVASYAPDVLILIDYPGFNLKMARFAHEQGIRVFWYIAPKLWARGEGRIRKLRRYVDELFVIFPFEVEYFRGLGMEAHYCGNPLLDTAGEPATETEKLIALLPGSREAELKWLMPRFVEMERLMASDPRWADYRLAVAVAPNMTLRDYECWLPQGSRISLYRDGACNLLRRSAAAVISSGTASLEAALVGTPQVVCYGFNRITYMLARMLVKVKYISLANLILDKLIFKELIQNESSAPLMLAELESLVFDEDRRAAMKADYALLRDRMGEKDAASRFAARMLEILRTK